ncbi:competence type IV pilus major pilin ComGC [Effusibacillus consociatus]|uniref:Competence type IV pilus major pilin ComGC n=1 Tax=Effusibacillus consociatus TaxID=1117041 RepID=A0ABV9Q4C2_9BACL
MNAIRRQDGFTLVELVISLFVISVIIAISIPHLKSVGEKAQTTACEGNQKLIRSQMENYYLAEHQWPNTLEALKSKNYLQTQPVCPKGGSYALSVSNDEAVVTCSKHPTSTATK